MFTWWKNIVQERKRKKREKWEFEQLSKEQKKKYFPEMFDEEIESGIDEIWKNLHLLEGKLDYLKESIIKKPDSMWKVVQDKDGEARWYRRDKISYVSNIYPSGPENAYYFDVVVDGIKITNGFKTLNEAESYRFNILNVERVEEYDEEYQRELFSEK